MSAICIYLHLHQPYRIRKYQVFEIGENHDYFDDQAGLDEAVEKSYAPGVEILHRLLKLHPEFKFSFSISGVLLDQLEKSHPFLLGQLQALIDTGRVELVSETYNHSLAFLYSETEFKRQVTSHTAKLQQTFGVTPQIYRNTELIHSNLLGEVISQLGFKGVLTAANSASMDEHSPGFVYIVPNTQLKLLVSDYRLSNMITARFSSYNDGSPLTAAEFVKEVNNANSESQVINLFLDLQSFGVRHSEQAGVFNFLNQLPGMLLSKHQNYFVTPSEAIELDKAPEALNIPHFVSWAELGQDLATWTNNSMQLDSLQKLYELEEEVLKSNDPDLIEDWNRLQASDHFYYMCTKLLDFDEMHNYLSPYHSPYEAFIAFMNVLQDIRYRLGLPTYFDQPNSTPMPNLAKELETI